MIPIVVSVALALFAPHAIPRGEQPRDVSENPAPALAGGGRPSPE